MQHMFCFPTAAQMLLKSSMLVGTVGAVNGLEVVLIGEGNSDNTYELHSSNLQRRGRRHRNIEEWKCIQWVLLDELWDRLEQRRRRQWGRRWWWMKRAYLRFCLLFELIGGIKMWLLMRMLWFRGNVWTLYRLVSPRYFWKDSYDVSYFSPVSHYHLQRWCRSDGFWEYFLERQLAPAALPSHIVILPGWLAGGLGEVWLRLQVWIGLWVNLNVDRMFLAEMHRKLGQGSKILVRHQKKIEPPGRWFLSCSPIQDENLYGRCCHTEPPGNGIQLF